MDALAFLKAKSAQRQSIYALVGDEDFLKRHARERIIATALGDEDPSFAVSVYAGDKLAFSTARNELETLPFFAPCRVVIVEDADAFVTANRSALENYVAKPSSVGVLVLDVKTFPDNTKFAKALPDAAKIVCKTPPAYKLHDLQPWLIEWAKTAHKKKLAPDAAELLLELVGASMGSLDQELGKLAVAVGANLEIAVDDVDRMVGRSKAADVFRIMDAIGNGRPGEALSILEELFTEGEDPMAILGPLTAQLRKLAAVGRLIAEGHSLGPAMDAMKVPKWDKIRRDFEQQWRRLGPNRLNKLTDWLVELNLGLKGGNALPERVQVERFVVMLARPLAPEKKKRRTEHPAAQRYVAVGREQHHAALFVRRAEYQHFRFEPVYLACAQVHRGHHQPANERLRGVKRDQLRARLLHAERAEVDPQFECRLSEPPSFGSTRNTPNAHIDHPERFQRLHCASPFAQ